jgi:hypothetical protein
MPQRPGDFGIEVVNGMAWLVRALEADETLRAQGEEVELHIQRLMPADALRIRGRHNAVNALAALALACAAGCALGPMLYGLREYRGEPHRVEPVGMSTASSISTTARAPMWAPRWRRCRAWGPSEKWWSSWAAKARGRTFPAGRAGGALCARGGADRARCAVDPRRAAGQRVCR